MTQAKFFEEKEDFEEEEERMPHRPGEPRDGGWGWVIVLGSFLCNVLVEGLISSYGLLSEEVALAFDVQKSCAMTVGAVMAGFYLMTGPIASVLVNKYGCRRVTIAGAVIVCVALLVSTHMPNIGLMTLLYGVVGGFGLGLIYLPSVVIVGYWFDKRRAFATGLAMCGAGVGMFIFPPLYHHLLEDHHWKSMTVIVAGLMLNCAVCGALYRPLSYTKTKRMQRGIVQHGAIMKALIAEKERQRTISNGSLDNCIITKDNKLIKIDKIDLRNKSNSYINRLKETFGFSSRSLNRSKNSLVVSKVPSNMVDPIYKGKLSPKPSSLPRSLKPSQSCSPPTPKRDSGCGSLESPKAPSYDAIPTDEPTTAVADKCDVASCKGRVGAEPQKSFSANNLTVNNNVDSPKKALDEKLDPAFLSVPVSPCGSRFSLNRTLTGSLPNGKQLLIPVGSSVMTVPSLHSMDTSSLYEEEPECSMCRSVVKMFDLKLLKSPTFLLLSVGSFLSMLGYFIPFLHLPMKAQSLGLDPDKAKFLISIMGVANLIGRFVAGWVSDRPWASAVNLNNFALICAGVLSFFSPTYNSQGWLTFYSFLFGFFTATFLSMRSIFVVELLGKEKLTSSFGLLILFQGVAVMIGSPLSERLVESYSNSDIGFYVVGACLMSAGILGLPLRRIKRWEEKWASNETLKIISIEELPMTESMTLENVESRI